MKALSVQQPWAWAIFHAGKNVENRTWPTRYRGPLLIHAAKSRASYDARDSQLWTKQFGFVLPPWDELTKGHLVGMVDVIDCQRSHWTLPERVEIPGLGPSIWAEPESWCWVLATPRVFDVPIPFRGIPGLFDVPDQMIPNPLA